MPPLEPVDRRKELNLILKTSLDNWVPETKTGKYTALYAPQAQGTGKTFLGKHLNKFIQKDIKARETGDSSSVVDSFKNKRHYNRIIALANTRPLVVDTELLSADCKSLKEAIVVNIASQLLRCEDSEDETQKLMTKVRELNLGLNDLCTSLLAENQALVIVLDDMPELLSPTSFPSSWFSRSSKFEDMDPKEKNRVVMGTIKKIFTPLLCMPGMILYMTGRAPNDIYKLLTTGKVSPMFATAVLIDALQEEDIVEMINNSPSTDELPLPAKYLRDDLGLCNDEEVSELARYVLFLTGGVARVVSQTLIHIEDRKLLLNRRADLKVTEILDAENVSDDIYTSVRGCVVYGIVPNWDDLVLTGWDTDMVKDALLKILNATSKDRDISTSERMEVGKGVQVTAIDLLSVLGVPFNTGDDRTRMTLQLGLWMTRCLLEDERLALGLGEMEVDLYQQWKWIIKKGSDPATIIAVVKMIAPKVVESVLRDSRLSKFFKTPFDQ